MKTIIEMAREANAEFAELPMMDAIVFSVDDKEWNSAELKRFVELVRADEREACAKVCDELLKEDGNWTPTGHRFATAIRARGNTCTPPQREWVNLTGQEKALIASVSLDVYDAVHRTAAKLKEKNT